MPMRPRSRLRPPRALAPVLACAAALAVPLAPSAARAAEWVDGNGTLPGSVCRKVGTAGALVIASDGSITNDAAWGTPALTVDCPLASAAQGSFINEATTVTYVDDTPGALNCILMLEDDNTTSSQTWSKLSTQDDAAYHDMSFFGIQGFAGGHAHFRCTIPPKDTDGNLSYLISYRLGDQLATDPVGNVYHTFPGTMCRLLSGTSLGITSDGAVYNPAAGNVVVDCALRTTRAGGTSRSKTKVWYLDSSPSALSCTLAAEAADSTSVSQVPLSSTFDDSGYHSFTYSGSNAISAFDDGYVHARCTIPPPDSGGALSYIVGLGLEIL